MRARLALYSSEITCELREVILRDKPKEMINISPKATVPVLLLNDDTVIDESIEIVRWSIGQNDPHNWSNHLGEMNALVQINDFKFKPHLDKYKYSSRNPELSMQEHRENGDFFLKYLDDILKEKKFLSGNQQMVTDLAVFPFIRQFAFVDKNYFDHLPYPHLQNWLDWHLESEAFEHIMKKHDRWEAGSEIVYFP